MAPLQRTMGPDAVAGGSQRRGIKPHGKSDGNDGIKYPRGMKRKLGDDGHGERSQKGLATGNVNTDDGETHASGDNSEPAHPASPSKAKEQGPLHTIVIPEDQFFKFLNRNFWRSLSMLISQSKRIKDIPPENVEENMRFYDETRARLDWMATNLEMTPHIRDTTFTRRMLKFACHDPRVFLPSDIKQKARELLEKWEAENWGEDEVVEDKGERADGEEDGEVEHHHPESPGAATDEVAITEVALPSKDDPIFGEKGFMHGIIVGRGAKGRKVYSLNPQVPRISSKNFGHNGLTVGVWFPLQIVALQRGAHGSRVGGIYGSASGGAYSIVASMLYDDLDQDHGDILFYSGSNSHENKDPNVPAPSTAGTKALKISRITRKPVRVLRSGGTYNSKKSNRFSPSCGIRYDGLYQVVDELLPKNKKGGVYEQFKLVRCPGQPALESIRLSSPTAQQVEALSNLQSRL